MVYAMPFVQIKQVAVARADHAQDDARSYSVQGGLYRV